MSERLDLQNKIHEFCDSIGVRYRIKENNQWQQKHRGRANKKYKGIIDDEIYVKGGCPLLFEYKIGYNKLSEKQIEWREYFRERGYLWHEIRDLDTGINIIKKHENIL